MIGLSFNTTAGGISWAGEFSYRPNLPLQVAIDDVVQTGLQPAFPTNDFLVDPTALLNSLMPVIGSLPTPDLLTNLAQLGGARFPGANTAVPSFLKTYRSEEHTSELQSLMRISYAVFCLKKNTTTT